MQTRRLSRAVRRRRHRLDRSARHARRPGAAALPLGLRHAAMPVEAPRRVSSGRATARSAWSRCRKSGCSRSCSRWSRRSSICCSPGSSSGTYIDYLQHRRAIQPRQSDRDGDLLLRSSSWSISARRLLAFAWRAARTWRLLWWLPLQRFGYRQIMYYVVVKSVMAALRGPFVGWGKLTRKATVRAACAPTRPAGIAEAHAAAEESPDGRD